MLGASVAATGRGGEGTFAARDVVSEGNDEGVGGPDPHGVKALREGVEGMIEQEGLMEIASPTISAMLAGCRGVAYF